MEGQGLYKERTPIHGLDGMAVDPENIQKMDRFEIYDSRKSLYDRGMRYIKEGNVEDGIYTLELLLDAVPEHEDAKKKLAEIYNEKRETLRKKRRRQKEQAPNHAADSEEKEYRLRQPTELERGEIDFYLSLEADALLIMLGQSTTGVLGAEFSPATAKKKGAEWLKGSREHLRKKICDEWSYCEKRNDEGLRDNVILATAIGDLVITAAKKIPPLAIACLLIKMGLDELCGCKKD